MSIPIWNCVYCPTLCARYLRMRENGNLMVMSCCIIHVQPRRVGIGKPRPGKCRRMLPSKILALSGAENVKGTTRARLLAASDISRERLSANVNLEESWNDVLRLWKRVGRSSLVESCLNHTRHGGSKHKKERGLGYFILVSEEKRRLFFGVCGHISL